MERSAKDVHVNEDARRSPLVTRTSLRLTNIHTNNRKDWNEK